MYGTLIRRALTDQGLNPLVIVSQSPGGSPMDNPAHYLRFTCMIISAYSSTSEFIAVMLGFALRLEPVLEFLEGTARIWRRRSRRCRIYRFGALE